MRGLKIKDNKYAEPHKRSCKLFQEEFSHLDLEGRKGATVR